MNELRNQLFMQAQSEDDPLFKAAEVAPQLMVGPKLTLEQRKQALLEKALNPEPRGPSMHDKVLQAALELQAQKGNIRPDLRGIAELADAWGGSRMAASAEAPKSPIDQAAEILKKIPAREEDTTLDELGALSRYEAAEAVKNRVARMGTGPGGMPKPTVGETALDRDYAKDYNDWTTRGKATFEKNLELLEKTATELDAKPEDGWISGRLVGSMPDLVRTDESISLRDNVRQAASASLKATLGSAFGEKEGERIMAQSYNEKLPPKENAKKIRLAIKELRQNAAAQEAKARHFENSRGTLRGFSAGDIPEVDTLSDEEKTMKAFEDRMKDW